MNGGQSEYLNAVSSDGTRLCVRSRGARERPAILFIHGFSQSHLSWRKQFDGPLADEFHLIAYDLRGHGWSDKPDDTAAYRNPQLWADDVAAVMSAAGTRRAVLVGWSYGGRVILDYVATCGAGTIAGINFVAGVVGDEGDYYGAQIGTIRATMERDPQASIDGTRRFLHACFQLQPETGEFERMLAYNAMVPPAIRAKLAGRKVGAHDVLAGLRVPVLFTQGALDGIIAPAMSQYGAQTVPGATLSVYEGIGHSPFFEDADRFDRELAAFVRTCNQ
jgi:pimeloyl-ACP methyl ester carboxylesterase